MKEKMKRILSLALALVLTLGILEIRTRAAEPADVTKLMDSCTPNKQRYTMNEKSRVFVVSQQEPTGSLLQTAQLIGQELAAGGWPSGNVLPLVWGPESLARDGDLILCLQSGALLAADGYQMDIGTKAKITAADTDGLLYGAHSLMRCFRGENATTIQGFTAASNPNARERTVHLDVARKYFTPEWIKNFIRQMSWMGYNALELHFSEDGGFRADFWDETYYREGFRPENDFSWLSGSRIQYWVHGQYRKDPDAGKYLTTEQLVDIVDTAAQYHIEIIPSFDSPAHMNYLTWKFKEHIDTDSDFSFLYQGKTYTGTGAKGSTGDDFLGYYAYAETEQRYRAINIKNQDIKAFVFAIYADIADFFRTYAGSTKFNIGGDEVNMTYLRWEKADFPGYVNDLNAMLSEKGYTCRMYNDFVGRQGADSMLSQINPSVEIVYWTSGAARNPSGGYPIRSTVIKPAADLNRTVYNGIQTSTYYVLRVTESGAYANMDARNPANRHWNFYNATEKRIFNQWKPAYFRACFENQIEQVGKAVEENLGGGYFMIWNDYAALSTEKQIWEGAPDSQDPAVHYYLLDRMWPNICKMWLPEINTKMHYDEFEPIQKKLGHFPGYTVCDVQTVLPAAAEPAEATLADHSVLEQLLADVKPNVGYTADSWQAYQTAVEQGKKVHADKNATQQAVDQAANAIRSAEAALKLDETIQDPQVVVTYQCGGQTVRTCVIGVPVNQTNFCVYVPGAIGYQVVGVEGGTYQPLATRDGSGFVSGVRMGIRAEVTLLCDEQPDASRLQYLVSHSADTTDADYQAALREATGYLQQTTLSQMQLNELVRQMEQTRSNLTAASAETAVLRTEPLAKLFGLGRQIGLRITTTPDVRTLTVDGVEKLTTCVGEVQTLSDGTTVKVWLLEFPADKTGTLAYTIHAGTASQPVSVTVG